MSTKPLQTPDLSQLPDPFKDMFGGMTDPTALMTMSNKQVNDIFNPKLSFDPNVKLSPQAQQTLGDIDKQNQALAAETNRMAEQLRRQRQEDERRANEQLKAQEEARKKKAEEQGGKLGAGADGSFILTPKIAEMLQSEAWNSIVSDKERTANAEAFISDLSTQLRSMGVADAEINNEVENARKIVSANVKSYVSEMNKDGQGLVDLAGGAAVKFGGFLSQLAGVATKGWAGIANGGDMNIDHSDTSVAGFLDYIGNSLVDAGIAANNWAENFQSSAVKLKKANADFDKRVYLAANPETEVDWGKTFEDGTFFDAAGNTVKGSAAAIKRLWDNDLILNTVADFAPQLLGTAGTGALAKQAIKPTIAKIAAAEAKGETVKLSARLLTGTVATKYGVVNNLAKLGSAERLAMGAYGTAMGVTDAGAGAYEQVMSADAATIEKHYGKTAWNNLLKSHGGDVEEAKKELASSALYSAVSGNAPIAAISSMFGIESAIGGLMARKAISESAKQLVSNGVKGAATKTAKWAGKSSLEALSEGVEEGYTQYQSNLGANPYTGVNPYEGVTDAAALGAFLGAASTGVMNAIDGVSNSRTRFNSTDDIIGEYARTGYLNYDQAKVAVGRNFEEINKLYSSEDNNLSIDAIHQLKQQYYDTMIDGVRETTTESGETQTASLLSIMTPEQRAEFKEWARLQEGVNTNDYAPYQASKEMNAWANGSIETIRKYGNKDLTNAYRLKHGIELEQIPQERSAYTKALLDTIEYMEQVPKNLNTRQREEQYVLFRNNRLNTDDNLSVKDIAGITTFASNILGANNRRMTDEQQAAYDRTHQAAQQVQANQQVDQNGTQEQNQTSTNQPTGQGAVTENAGTVAQQGFTDGARASDTLGAIAKELAATEPTGQGSNNAQSVGNDPVQQATVASNQADNTTASGASPSGNSQGLGQTSNTGYTQPTTTPTSNSGQTAQQGLTGQTSQNGQPIGQIRPSTTQTPVSSGGVGTAPSERNTNGRSQQAVTQADVNDSFLADPANETYVKSFINVAYNDLGKFGQGITKHKADLRKLVGITGVVGGKLSDEHIDKLYNLINMPIAERTALINNEFRTQTAINRVHNAVHHLKQNTIKAIKSAIKSQEQARRSAERAAEQQVANQALQQEREQLAEQKRLEKQERDEQIRLEKQARVEQERLEKQERAKQALIDKTEVDFLKADSTAAAKEQAAQKANELLADLTAHRQAIQDELSKAKADQKAKTAAYKEATTAFNKAVNEVTKAKTAEKRELGKEKRKGLRLAWLSRVEERNEANMIMRQAKQEADMADKAVSTATASLSAINVKIKEAQIKARDADRVAKQARARADKIFDKLTELRPETTSETTQLQDTLEQQVLLLGYQSVEQAQNELVPLVDNYQVQTVEQAQELTNVLASTMGVPVGEVKQYLLDSPLVDDTFAGDVIDMVFDEASNIWTIADTQTEQQGLSYVNEQTETTGRPRTQAIGSTNYRQISFSEPSTTTTPETTAGTSEVTTPETSEVTTADGATFNLQEILSGVTNKRIRNGEVPPTLNDLAPEDDTADRPTIELTINGKTHTGKLYRFRKGNRRFIAFIHDGNAYGMKAVKDGVENQDWINFGAGIGTKRVDSINAQTAISIRVLDGTPTQQDLFSQPQGQNTTRRSLDLTLSASTGSISGLKRLQDIIDDPNISDEEKAHAADTLNNIAYSHLSDLVADIDGVTLSRNSATGLYGGAVEPSLLVNVEVDEQAEPQLRAALVKFAENFNQEQVHMRQETTGDIGRVYPDGSFNTVTYQIELNTQIDRATIDQIIADSGLFGLTVYTNKAGNSVLEFYYYGKPTDTDAINEFRNAARRAAQSVSAYAPRFNENIHRAWFYAQPNIAASWGAGFTIPYTSVPGGLYTQPKNQPNAVVSAVAKSLNPTARGFEQKNITKKQFAKQHAIAKDYDKAPLYDLDNPIVRRAYEALVAEVKEQYLAMPLRGVELIIGKGEPYANSTEMREDVRVNNKIKVFATTPDSFGSNPNIDYSQHPLLQDSGLTDINGQTLLMNDLLRAVHDYYAHTMSPTTFGPKGEEAAWKNHLSMIKSPWAAWALTTETRGQNSWVNFRDEVQDVPLKDRPFADQKTVLLPLKHVYTGQADIDAKLDALREELVETYGKAALQGSLAVKEKLTSDVVTQADIDTAYKTYTRKPNPTDVIKFTAKDGTVILLEYESNKSGESNGVTNYYFKAVAMNGDHVGDLTITNDKRMYPDGSSYTPGSLVVKRALIGEDYQRKDIGKAIYSFAEEKLGVNLLPPASMSAAARAMWSSWKGQDFLSKYGLTDNNGGKITAINQQEIDNETHQTGRVEDSNQYADTQTQDENNTDTVGDNPRTDVGQGEIPSESGRGNSTGSQASGNETTNRPVGSTQTENDGNQAQSVQVTTYPNNLTRKERNAISEVAQYEDVPVDTVYQAIADGNISFFTGTGATSGADVSVMARELVNQEIADNVDKAVDLIKRLTTAPVTKENTPSGNSLVDDYFAQNPKDKAELENYLARTRRTLEQAVNAELDKQADYAERDDYKRAEQAYEQAAQYQQELKALPANAVEMVNAYLTDGVALKDAVNQAIRSTRPATNGFTFDSLPQGIKDILNKIWNSLKKTVAAVSMAVAVYTGSNFVVPNEAMAATPVETATVQHIVQTNDNQGKSFIVADKQAGTLTVYNAAGQELTSTPALFGKNVGDSIKSKNTTPSGRYDLTRATNINNNAYGNSAQVLTVNGQMQTNNAGNLAIHRVLTSFPSENRVGRLNSATASDNRISHGCINVPASFYDTHLDNVGDAVVYVLPETDAGRTGVFNVNVPTTDTAVEPRMDNANAQSVEVKPSDIQSAPTTYSEPKQAPVKALAPITIAGTQPSGQVAYVAPVVVGGVTADQVNVPFDVHTPAELQANGVYDTEPVSGSLRSDGGNGFNIYDIAAWLAGIGAVAKTISKRRKKKLTSKKNNEQSTTDNANEETITSEQNPSGTARNEQAQAAVDDNHNAKVNKSASHVIKNAQAPSRKTQIADGVTRAMWIEYIASQHAFDGENLDNDLYSTLVDTMLGFEWVIDDVMRDRTIEQANDGTFADPLKWRNDITDKKRAGISAKLMNFAAGATQVFDNLMTEHGIARVGHEMDSSIPSKHLAQIKAKASGAYAQLHKLYVKPLVLKVDRLAGDLRMGYVKLEQDIGRVATVKHVLNEAADAMWRGREHIISTHQEQLEAVNQAIANTADGNEIRLVLTSKARLLQNEIREQTELLNKARDMYNGVIPWDGKTGLPGGYTKAQAEKVLAGLKAKYGNNFSKVEQMATETVQTIRGIRNFATAAGVFSNADLRTFADLGFTEYVPLYAEQKDPLETDETDTYTKQSVMDKLTADLPNKEARAMGLTKDLSRYHREGATSPAADAFTNMKVFSMNMAGRIGQQGWLNSVQQLYEGTVGKPISATAITDEELLKELNASHDSGKLPGLIRVRPGMEQYVGIDQNKLKPIVAKGHNAYGEVVTFHYYFTEPAIQAEIYSNSDLNETLAAKGLRNVGTLTRFAARMMTTFKPVWNVYNWARDSLERISIMLMRPVKDKDGNLVNKWDLSKAYFKNLAVLASSKSAQSEIYRYLVLGETKTKLQKILHEAVGEGAINLITSQTEKHSILADLNKSTIDKLTSQAASMLGESFNKAGAGGIKRGADKLVEMYVMRLTEVPQITTSLAAYMAYQDVGVNKGETANRVRDQYDPLRANNKVINSSSQLFPFIRSTFSGHYNLGRTLTEYWKPGTWQAPLAYMVVGTLGTMAVLTMMSGMFGDDEDGVPEIARLPIGTLMNGIPVPVGDNGVWSLPVGFGMNKLVWGIGANLWRQSMGMQTGGETAKQLLGLVVDNTSPIQAASGNVVAENPVAGLALTFTPLLAKPLMEIATNTKSFGGAKIINRETPKDQYDSDQDNFNTPETYKTWARALRETTGIDMRPETIRHLIESYSYGPFGAIPKSIIQDQSDKTLGNVQRKGEVFGPLLTAIGADMAIQPNALDYAQQTYAMQELRMELHKRYGIGETHNDEDYAQYADRGKRGGVIKRADVVTERAMRDKGVPEHIIQYVVNGMRYNKARQAANKNFTELSKKYYELRRQGKDDPTMRMEVQAAWDELEELTYNYVKENNRAYFEIMQQQ